MFEVDHPERFQATTAVVHTARPEFKMSRKIWIVSALMDSAMAPNSFGQQAFTWTQVRDKFEASNPSLLAGRLNIEESHAQEITAYLRPNPDFTASVDQLDIFTPNQYRPLQYALPNFSSSYLHEREHKRELRLESAKKGTSVARSQQDDLEPTLLFSLRNAFVQALQAKAILALARDSLAYYDRVLPVSRDRLTEGDIARVDMQRLHLQRVQYVSDVQTADVNVRTAKIQLLALLTDRTPVEQFDVTGPFEFSESIMPLDDFRKLALDARPDLRAAVQSVDKAKTDHQLAVSNGSTDPTFAVNVAIQNPPIPVYAGFSVDIPIRIFDRNQGEKARTELDIQRNEGLREVAAAQVYNDVDSAYATLNSSIVLLRPYKADYLDEAASVRTLFPTRISKAGLPYSIFFKPSRTTGACA